MGAHDLITFSSPEELARAAAARWLEEIRSAALQNSIYSVALAGGRIAARFFWEIAAQAKSGNISLDRVHFFWSDERCVPPSDPESNYALANTHLLQPLQVPADKIHRIAGEAPPALAANAAEADLRRLAPSVIANQPVVDLVLLGLGEEGHVASLFPGESEETMASRAVFRPTVVPKPPPRRITMGYPTLAAARQVWVLVSGNGKQEALRESLREGGKTPLARVLRARSRTRIFTDLAL